MKNYEKSFKILQIHRIAKTKENHDFFEIFKKFGFLLAPIGQLTLYGPFLCILT